MPVIARQAKRTLVSALVLITTVCFAETDLPGRETSEYKDNCLVFVGLLPIMRSLRLPKTEEYYYNSKTADELMAVLEKAAQDGSASDKYSVGTLYFYGNCSTDRQPRLSQAAIWYKAAAEQALRQIEQLSTKQ